MRKKQIPTDEGGYEITSRNGYYVIDGEWIDDEEDNSELTNRTVAMRSGKDPCWEEDYEPSIEEMFDEDTEVVTGATVDQEKKQKRDIPTSEQTSGGTFIDLDELLHVVPEKNREKVVIPREKGVIPTVEYNGTTYKQYAPNIWCLTNGQTVPDGLQNTLSLVFLSKQDASAAASKASESKAIDSPKAEKPNERPKPQSVSSRDKLNIWIDKLTPEEMEKLIPVIQGMIINR